MSLVNARFKGGWGPGRDGLYLVRQYGLVATGHGQLAVAMAAVAGNNGVFNFPDADIHNWPEWGQQLQQMKPDLQRVLD